MPNTREKLIKLLDEAYCDYRHGDGDCDMIRNIAEHLISHGVTIQEDCHWATEQAYKNGYAKGFEDGLPKWIPLTEQKPDRDELVIVFFEGMRDTNCAIQIMYGWCLGGSASHWMPLPEPPKGD